MSHEPWPFRHDSEQPPAGLFFHKKPLYYFQVWVLLIISHLISYLPQESLSSGVLYNFGPFFFFLYFVFYLFII